MPGITLCFLLLASSVWAETGTFATTGPQFLLKNGDFRQLTIVIIVLGVCLWGIIRFSRENK